MNTSALHSQSALRGVAHLSDSASAFPLPVSLGLQDHPRFEGVDLGAHGQRRHRRLSGCFEQPDPAAQGAPTATLMDAHSNRTFSYHATCVLACFVCVVCVFRLCAQGIPVNQQKLERCEEADVELVDATSLEGKEHLRLLVRMDGGCECRPFYIRIQDFESAESSTHRK